MGYTKDAVKGVSWLGGLRIALRAISFFRLYIIIRVIGLDQQDIGLFSIAAITLAFLEIITETGINVYLIQKKESIEKYINTAWVISIIRGIVISLFILLFAPLIATFFEKQEVYNLLLFVAAIPFLRGFINPAIVSFTKNLHFEKEFLYRASNFFVESVFTILFVLYFQSALGMVLGVMVGVLYEVILSFLLITPHPSFSFEREIGKDIFKHGKWLTLSGILLYLFQNIDTIIVGKLLGISTLGVYDTVYKLSVVPLTEFSDVISRTALPILVQIEDDRKRFLKAIQKTIGTVLLIIIPVCLLLSFFSTQLITIFLGPSWVGGSDTLRVLFILCIVRSIIVINNTIFLSKIRQDLVSLVTSISLAGLLLSIFPFISFFGMKGAAYAALLGSSLSLPFSLFLLFSLAFQVPSRAK